MALREIIAHFGFDFDKSGADKADKAIGKTKAKTEEGAKGFGVLLEAAKALAAVEIVRVAGEWVRGFAEAADQIGDVSEAVGISTGELQVWNLGARENGISAEEFSISLRKLASAAAGGADEMGSQSKIFDKLKIKTHGAHGEVRGLGELLPEIADHFKNTADGAAKAALAQELFGRKGAKLIPLLNQGSDGIEQLTKDFEELGGGFSDESIKRAGELEKQTGRLSVAFDSLKSRLLVALLPRLNDLLETAAHLAGAFGDWADSTTLLESGVSSLATAIGVALWAALAPFIGPALEFVAIFLAVDDLKGFLQGQDSEIADILNGWFGDGTADVVRDWILDAATWFRNGFTDIQAAFPVFREALATVLADTAIDFDNFVLGLENKWNGLVASLGLNDRFKVDVTSRVSELASDTASRDAHGAATLRARAALDKYTSDTTPTAGAIGSGAGPVRAPIEYHNSVELKPTIQVTVPPGTPAAMARNVARATADQVSENYRSALQSLQAATAGQGG